MTMIRLPKMPRFKPALMMRSVASIGGLIATFAFPENFGAAIFALSRKMNFEEDVLVLSLSSHGAAPPK
jgi:hypothetical protein